MATMPRGMVLRIPATLHLDSRAGRRTYRIRVTGETRENFRIEALEDIPMPSRRWLKAGEHGHAPKSAVTPNAVSEQEHWTMTIKLAPARTREKIESIRGHAVDVWTFGRGGRPDLPWLMADEKRFQWALDHLPWKNDNAIAELARHRFASDANANTMVSRVRTLRRFLIQCADVIGLPHVREVDGAVRLLPLRAARSARDIYVRAQEEFHSRTSRTRAPLPALLGDPELFEAFYRRLGWMSLSDIHEDLVTYLGPRRGLHVNQLSRVWMFLDRHHLSPTGVHYRRGLPRPVYGIWRKRDGRVIRTRGRPLDHIEIACNSARFFEVTFGPWDRWTALSRKCFDLNHALIRHAFSGASQ